MSTQSYLIFSLNTERFAIDALAVKEIVWLPELTLEEEVPDFIAGAFNLRGKIVHVMDLNICFGHEPGRNQVTDRVIILEVSPHLGPLPQGARESSIVSPPLTGGGEGEGVSNIRSTHDERRLLGIIVSDVHDVVSVPESDIEPTLTLRPLPEGEGGAHLIAGEAKVGEEIIMVLDHDNLVGSWELGVESHPHPHPGPLPEGEGKMKEPSPLLVEGKTPAPSRGGVGQGWSVSELTPEEKAIFHERALNLMKEAVEEVEGLVPLAVFGLNGEYYGANLEAILEFSDIRSVTPVPCTPPHIVGDMNLRGDILTLVDIRGLLNIPLKRETTGQKAIVARINDLLAGIPVNEVFEVIYVNPSDIRPVPTATESIGDEYIKGEVAYGGKMLSILDLQRILTREELVVEENK